MSDMPPNAAPADAEFISILGASSFQPIVEPCHGCGHVRSHDGNAYCRVYASPEKKWELKMCNFATHKHIEKTGDARKVNPLKASKRGSR
jgi:hypothetical protein